ncbi:hypothetical protein LguiA_011204 [Lonicera macranthoides]
MDEEEEEEESESSPNNKEIETQQQVLKVLEALKQASHELQTHPTPNSSTDSAIKALLELETESDTILSTDPHLSTLSQHLTYLKTLIEKSAGRRHGLRSFLSRRVSSHAISKVAGEIESEIQAWIDRETIETLIRSLQKSNSSFEIEENVLIESIKKFKNRVSQGFDRELQDLILKSKVYSELELILCNPNFSIRVQEEAASAIAELIHFNKDVFVGQVLMGQTIRAIVSMRTLCSIKVLCQLIKYIKSPLVDDIASNGEIPKIINLLSSEDLLIRTMAMDCVLEIGYYGRKEAIEAMVNVGLIKKLVELQRSEIGGDLIDMEKFEEREGRGNREREEIRFLEKYPFASCVARFAVQLEVGEGLRQRERRALKQEILKRVREASLSDAEAATIIAEVLWGSSP